MITVAKQVSDLHTSTLVQTAMDEFCRRGLMVRHLKRFEDLRRSRDAMAEALRRYFPRDSCSFGSRGRLVDVGHPA